MRQSAPAQATAGTGQRNSVYQGHRRCGALSPGWVASLLAGILGTLSAQPAAAWIDLAGNLDLLRDDPRGIHILDGSYFMDAGELQINITNFGLIGSMYSVVTTFADAPSAQWPAGSGNEYLWAAGLWVGGVVLGEPRVSTGAGRAFEFRPREELQATIYEAVGGIIERPPGNDRAGGRRAPDPEPDDDEDGRVDEEILNGYDDDDDRLIDEDFAQIGNQMMVCTTYDNTQLAQEVYTDHTPLELEVVQKAFAWEGSKVRDFVGFEFDITNIGVTDINNVYIGFFADCDIGPRNSGDTSDDDMVGFYDGAVRSSDGSFTPVTVAYMYDFDEANPIPGYFGILFLGRPGTPGARIRSFQRFIGQQPFVNGGDPTNDFERYELMSAEENDANSTAGREGDYRFLVSAGPWDILEPDQTVRFQAVMVIGEGFGGLLQSCAEAAATWRGAYFDLDNDAETGIGGRETRFCFSQRPGTGHWIYQLVADYMDQSCFGPEVPLDLIVPDDFDILPGGLHCIWVNLDNCDECDRRAGERCTPENGLFSQAWDCNRMDLPPLERLGCTGVGGAESQVNWLVGMAPPPPDLRIWPTNQAVHVFWSDSSEHAKDIRLNLVDFESYRLWRADNWDRPFGASLAGGPESNLWQLIAEFDVVNHAYPERILTDGRVVIDTIAMGANTGLADIVYRPRVLDDSTFGGLAEAMQAVVLADTQGLYRTRPLLRDSQGAVVPELVGLLPWEDHPTVLDTFFMVTGRPEDPAHHVAGKRGMKFYEYIDRDIHNGFVYFYSVTATDHEILFRGGRPRVTGPGQAGNPGSSFIHTSPGSQAQSLAAREKYGANIYVYPNPATREALAEFQQMHPNADDPTGLRVVFANLPAARNTINIYTLDGDLVQQLFHDGSGGHGEVAWNLVSRNGQQIVSGICLYTVQADDHGFEDFIGKFVVIR